MKTDSLVMRCYAHRRANGTWYGICLDLNIAAEAESYPEVRKKINSMICSYIETVLDTEDRDSIPQLIRRKAPLRDWLIYYVLRFINYLKRFQENFTFKETIPFHLSYNC